MEKNFTVIAITDFVAGAWETLYKSTAMQEYRMAIVNFDDIIPYRSALSGGANFDQFYVSLNSNANVTKVIEDLNQKCSAYGYNLWIGTAQGNMQSTQNSYNQVEVAALSVTAFSVVISAIGMMPAMACIILERKREIGVLIAIGLDKRQNMGIVIGETILLVLLGTTIGVISGLALTSFVLQVIPWWTNVPPPALILSTSALLLTVAVIGISAVVGSAYPANRVAKLNVVDALRK